jgi:hypothetical protein|tara:strand:+ start:14136 stop:15986 length:1851 start_codon:yes stop_codon:yes gene_type:complete
MNRKTARPAGSTGILRRLARDEAGNALVIVTAAVFPLLGAIGGGIDLTRGYMAEARLAQTCDAAALAGRKVMEGDDVPVMGGDDAGSREIDNFVDFNFQDGLFNSETVNWEASLDDTSGELSLTLRTSIPTTMMRVVGVENLPISLSCSSVRSGSNVDVVLVLDTTGSMQWDLDRSYGYNNERINELKRAAKRFVSIMGTLRDQLNKAGLRVRVGIVPYSQTVNIGHQLMDENVEYVEQTNSHYYSLEYTPRKCDYWNYYCSSGNRNYDQQWRRVNPRFGKQTFDLTNFIARGRDGSIGPYDWKGCVEMRTTIQSIDAGDPYGSIPAGAWDIIDEAPGNGVPKWQPYLVTPNSISSQATYTWPNSGDPLRNDPVFGVYTDDTNLDRRIVYTVRDNRTGPQPGVLNEGYYNASYYPSASTDPKRPGPNSGCPSPVELLDEHPQSHLEAAIDTLVPAGGTYHNIGMYWGIALLSNEAPFINTDTWPVGGAGGRPGRPVAKYLIFMTDGTMDTSGHSYSAYGIEFASDYRNHVRPDTGSSTGNQHRARFRMLCEYAKQQGIQVHTVAFTRDVGDTDEEALRKCASSTDDYYQADSGRAGELEEVFEKIGRNIGYLRVSQ